MPYHVRGVRDGAVDFTRAWRCSAMLRSWSDISAIFERTSLSPSGAPALVALSSRVRSFIAARSSVVNPFDVAVAVCVRVISISFVWYDATAWDDVTGRLVQP